MRVAVIGAGLSGTACAQKLSERGADVIVFDKGRGFGGRLSSRRTLLGGETIILDHGAPTIEIDEPGPVRSAAEQAVADGSARWIDDRRLVGAPFMSELVASLGRGLDVRFGIRVGSLEPRGALVAVISEAGNELGVFDRVIVTAPAPQTLEITREIAPELVDSLARVTFLPDWVALLTLSEDVVAPGDRIDGDGEVIEAFTGRGQAWVARATRSWTDANLELELDEGGRRLAERAAAVDARFSAPALVSGHRWRYSRVANTIEEPFLKGEDGRVLVCGDGFGGPCGQYAWASGLAAAEAVGG